MVQISFWAWKLKEIEKNRKLWLNQRKYVETILQRFNMHECKSVKVPIHVGVNLSADQYPKTDTGRGGGHVSCSICECSWQFDVCNGLYYTGHGTCSGSFEHVYVKTREGELDIDKKGFRVFAQHC